VAVDTGPAQVESTGDGSLVVFDSHPRKVGAAR